MIVSQVDRGSVYNERMQMQFRVSGNNMLSVDADGVATFLGTIAGSSQCAMPYSFQSQAVVVDGHYYLYDTDDGFREITDPDLGFPIDCTWVDNYYFFTDGEYLFHTNIGNESQINPLQFATAEFSPDPTVGVGLTVDNKVIAFNRYTTEYFQNVASANFAFTRLSARNVMAGIVATHAKVRIDGTYYCMGGSKESDITIYALGTGNAVNISSRSVNKILRGYNENQLQNVVMEGLTFDNYTYLIAHLPNEVLMLNLTLAAKVGPELAWSVLASASEQNTETPYRAINGVFDGRRGQWVYGDKFEPVIGFYDPSVATQYGQKVPCEINTPFLYMETASIDEMEINTIPGFTTTDDAQVFMSLTNDGVGYTQEYPLQYGQPSEYEKRFIGRRFGYVRNWMGIKLRWLSQSRMAFATAKLTIS
jgi:hypothetical protein